MNELVTYRDEEKKTKFISTWLNQQLHVKKKKKCKV